MTDEREFRADENGERDLAEVRAVLPEHDAPLAECLEDFWTRPAGSRDDRPAERGTERAPGDGLLRQLDDPGARVRGHDLHELLRPAYVHMTRPR
ncbi:hypothetical protein FHX42_000707 [Saccharopolyspora lacisalsi]|uniref:Uncharacterized protein n=1 Tax=Halosaccharopolyspora lacisalsi TaxID=1000566 RepID=A0A839DXB2_9PSEU|nr:hypothetical protein [Halosaccharopolyspora lacisalsi]MBA8823378.1 hypothetical protein [Halosaccharopolyspora lacisalsi]